MPLSPWFQRSRQRRTSSGVVPGSRPMKVYGKIVVLEVVLRREIVGFRLALLADLLGVLVHLVHVMRNGPQVVEELAEHVPSAVLAITSAPRSSSPASATASLSSTRCPSIIDIAEAFVGWRARSVGGLRGGGEPALVDAAAMRAQRIEIAGSSFRRPPGIRKERGTQQGAKRKRPSFSRRASSTICVTDIAILHAAIFDRCLRPGRSALAPDATPSAAATLRRCRRRRRAR